MGKQIHESQRAHRLTIAFCDVSIAIGIVLLFMLALMKVSS